MVLGYLSVCAKQHAAMNLKHFLEGIRSPKSTFVQLIFPILAVLIFWSVVRNQSAPISSESVQFSQDLPPSCKGCNRITYWPLNADTFRIMNHFAENTQMSIAPLTSPLSSSTQGKFDIIGLSDSDYSTASISYQQKSTDEPAIQSLFQKGWDSTVGISFVPAFFPLGKSYYNQEDSYKNYPSCFVDAVLNKTSCVAFTVYSNNTFDIGLYRNRVTAEVSNAIFRMNGLAKVDAAYSYRTLPNGPSSASIIAKWAETGLLTFVCTFSFIFIFSNLAAEADLGMRGYLKTMGLKDWVYWSSWFCHHYVLFAIPVSIVLILGYNLSGLHLFRATSVPTMLLIVFSYGASAIAWASAWCTILKKPRIATILGFFFFLAVLIFSVVCTFPYISYFLNYNGYTFLIPTWHFIRIITAIQIRTAPFSMGGSNKNQEELVFNWDMMKTPLNEVDPTLSTFFSGKPDPWTPLFSFGMMWVNTFFYIFAMWYLDKVFPDDKKATLPIWFPFLPSFWGFRTQSSRGFNVTNPISMLGTMPVDPDLKAEMENAARGDTDLSIQGLRKVYSPLPFLTGGKTALQNFYLCANQGTIVALLGHNGAGKTTLINILTGKVNPTAGDAILFGESINDNLAHIQASMGICPQHDVLWPDLTAQEHMKILSTIKPSSNDDTNELLTRVKLNDVTSLSSQFSGGMKRRLQLAISILGNPRIIFLDEPTTGMDPVNRRRVWDLIRDLKADKLIFLTTHAMEEAEVLGEKIAVMVDGDLRSVGSSLHLKNKYATGYRLSVICMEGMQPQVQTMFATQLPQAKLMEANSANLVYSIPADEPRIGSFMQALQEVSRSHIEALGFSEEERPSLIRDWGLSNSTLEDVFLKVTRQ